MLLDQTLMEYVPYSNYIVQKNRIHFTTYMELDIKNTSEHMGWDIIGNDQKILSLPKVVMRQVSVSSKAQCL